MWNGENLYELYQIAHTPWEWHKPIMELAKRLGILCFSTPFDETAVDFLENLNVPAYKIASFENIDIPLIKKVARTKKAHDNIDWDGKYFRNWGSCFNCKKQWMQ